MRTVLTAIVVVCVTLGQGEAGNYTLTLDDKQCEIDIGKPVTIELADGRSVVVTLEKKDYVTFRTEFFSFDHSSELLATRGDMEDGLFHTTLTSPSGTVILIQEYYGINPCDLIDMMIRELTKEEVQYGYELTESPSERTLSNGMRLKGKKAVTDYRQDEWTRHVLCHEARDAGIVVVTIIEKSSPPEDYAMIETLWETLEISLE